MDIAAPFRSATSAACGVTMIGMGFMIPSHSRGCSAIAAAPLSLRNHGTQNIQGTRGG